MRTTTFLLLFALVLAGASFSANAKCPSPYYRIVSTDTLPARDTTAHEVDLANFTRVDVEAEFPGGVSEWQAFIGNNLKANVPVKRKAPAGQYMVVVQFIVGLDGRVTDIKALTHYGYGMEEEVVRVISKSPRWSPAMINGRPVRAYRKQPVTFSVTEK